MNNTAEFAGDFSLTRFADKLPLANDPIMSMLLLKELRNLGFDCEQLGNVQHRMAEGSIEMEYRKLLSERLTANSRDIGRAESGPSNLVEIQRIFEQHHQAPLDTTDRNTLPCEADAPHQRRASAIVR
jgi:hypothetical protein